MCIILDANLFSDYLQNTPDMKPVRRWLEGGRGTPSRGKLAYSPTAKFRAELGRHRKFKTKLDALNRAGLLKMVPESKVAEEEGKLPNLKSDDPHIVALALAGRVSLLVSRDQALHKDFKDVVGGKVYQTATHRGLLTPDLCA